MYQYYFRKHRFPIFLIVSFIQINFNQIVVAQDSVRTTQRRSIEFQVTVPSAENSNRKIYLAGDPPFLGNWKPDGLELKPQADGYFKGQFDVEIESDNSPLIIEFKLTQGCWDTVEKDTMGNDISNRRLLLEYDPSKPEQKVFIDVQGWGNKATAKTKQPIVESSTVVGQLKFHRDFASQHLVHHRHIAVWVPPCYANSDRSYPVLYLHDGQNLFDRTTAAFGVEWQVDETATRLIQRNRIQPIMIVGIWNTADRIDEYTPSIDLNFERGGKADQYLKSLVEEIKPLIDLNYRTLPDRDSTAIAGSSLGGLVSIYACKKYPDIFSKCAALSPSLGWDQESLLKKIESNPGLLSPIRCWVDMGTLEGPTPKSRQANVARLKRLVDALESSGLRPDQDFKWKIVPEGQHNEAAWAERFEDVLEFFYAIN